MNQKLKTHPQDLKNMSCIREDTHKKIVFFFSGRTTKGYPPYSNGLVVHATVYPPYTLSGPTNKKVCLPLGIVFIKHNYVFKSSQ